MRTFLCLLFCCLGTTTWAQRVHHQNTTTTNTHALPVDPTNCHVPDSTTFEVAANFAQQIATLRWNPKAERLTAPLKIQLFDFNNWELISEFTSTDFQSGFVHFPKANWPAGIYIVQIDYLDGSPIMLMKFNWAPED